MSSKQKAGKAAAKAAKKNKQELKTEKSQRKKEAKELDGEEDIQTTVSRIEKARKQNVVEKLPELIPCPPPGPRSNFSICQSPISDELVMFGGQYFDGATQFVYGETYRWHFVKNEWRQVLGLGPSPRSCHQAVVHKHCMYLFGGEYSTMKQFYHFRDLWRFDMRTNVWTQLPGTGPCPRSGHRMVVWKSYIVLFGGFHDTFRDCKYYNDLHLFNVAEERWEKLDVTSVNLPSPRSGCGFFLHPTADLAFVYGGYVRDKKVSGTDLSDLWQLTFRQVSGGAVSVKASWERLSKKGTPPSRRSGASFAVHKHRALVFGGVYDKDTQGLTMESEFFNELYAFDMDRKRWYVLDYNVAAKSGTSRRRKQPKMLGDTNVSTDALSETEVEESKFEWIFEYVDENGQTAQIVVKEDDPLEEEQPESEQVVEDVIEPVLIDTPTILKEELLKEEAPQLREMIDLPPERMGAAMFVVGNTLSILGGISEVRDKEVTYDDCWTLDLNARDRWVRKLEGTMAVQVWRGEEESEDEEEIDFSSSDSNDSSSEDDSEAESVVEEKLPRMKKSLKTKMEDIRLEHDLNEQHSPLVGETLKDFFARTQTHWRDAAVAANPEVTGAKELRGLAFGLAGTRFQETAPILAKLKEFEEEQQEEEKKTSRRKPK